MKKIRTVIASMVAAIIFGLIGLAPVSAAALGERVLQVGAIGDDVRELQIKLNGLGFNAGTVDGIFGPKTQNAVKMFEKANNLESDGIADQDLLTIIQKKAPKVFRDAPVRYKQILDIVATAYAPGPHDNGKWGNLTHIGTQVRPGIIAVDPKVIPLGTRVYIEFPDGHGMYAVAEDTGGAIKGNRIDIAMWTVAEAYNFGIQKVKVYILD
ncbi:3D domain-containing protein [Sporolituus thermophilus]|uniref:3D (Asp-Asp-Asp) domain-containing protein n=1 Tax=Sporolituus thermophilus DSM 23256 TaxID=1123285 RepID=A0A1G7KUL4_9FIRM|nr:3D domain-containing protein [Sporolituus thermophilus]SDF40776.1 3D (Asp-Asp-Asp) domain-containing protein [Sporolituus thermophilus DSM 23256]